MCKIPHDVHFNSMFLMHCCEQRSSESYVKQTSRESITSSTSRQSSTDASSRVETGSTTSLQKTSENFANMNGKQTIVVETRSETSANGKSEPTSPISSFSDLPSPVPSPISPTQPSLSTRLSVTETTTSSTWVHIYLFSNFYARLRR